MQKTNKILPRLLSYLILSENSLISFQSIIPSLQIPKVNQIQQIHFMP